MLFLLFKTIFRYVKKKLKNCINEVSVKDEEIKISFVYQNVFG